MLRLPAPVRLCRRTDVRCTGRIAGAAPLSAQGPRTTHDLCEGICLHCADASTVLDIGPGIGALTFELLEAGVQHATDVDASSAFLDAAREEAARRLTGNDFEVFVHPASRMEEIVRRAGFALARRRGRWVWGADIYIRNRMAPKS